MERLYTAFGVERNSDIGALFVLSLSVFLVYISFGYLQESIIREPGFIFMDFMTLFQNFFYFFLAFLDFCFFGGGFRLFAFYFFRPVEGASKFLTETKRYTLAGILVTATVWLSNLSLLYLSYPVQQLFKSCKLLPVMFSRIVLIGGGYSAKEYISCLSLMIGLAIFTIADKMSNANISFAGLLIILSALTFDGLSGGVLEIVLRSPVIEKVDEEDPKEELIEEEIKLPPPRPTKLYSEVELQRKFLIFAYGMATIFVALYLIFTHQLGGAIEYHRQHPIVFAKLIALGCNSYLGVRLVIELVQRFDSGVATAVTTMRKFSTVLLSYFFFPRPLSIFHVIGSLMVILGFYGFNSRLLSKK